MIVWRERYLYVFLIFLSILACVWIIPTQVQEGQPRVLPYLTVLVILLCSLVSLFNCLRGKKEVEVTFPKSVFYSLALGIFLYGLYIFLLNYIGYFSLTIIFILLIYWHIKLRKPLQIFSVAIIVPFCIYLLLSLALGLSFPSGLLP